MRRPSPPSQSLMQRPSFLDRQSFGLPHYLWLALLAVMLLAVIPPASRRAVQSNSNRAEDWLPASYDESAELDWYRQHFGGEAFMVVSWEGCTLAGDDRLSLLADKLRRESAKRIGSDDPAARMFSRVVTGRELIDQLTEPPASLSREEAIARLSGAVVGPLPAASGDEQPADGQRITCLVAYLGPEAIVSNKLMRVAIERMVEIATGECNIPRDSLHYGGPPVDNVTIDIEAETTLLRLAWLSGLVGLTLAYLCFRSKRVTGMVLAMAVASAMLSLALVFYWGVIEVFLLGYTTPRLGRLDAVMMSMPAVVYVLGLSGAIHLVNYYRDAIDEGGREGAVERAVSMAWVPCGLAALTTALGLASLGTSDILPIKKFGIFTAAAVVGTLVLLYTVVPVGLHRFPPRFKSRVASEAGWLDRLIARLAKFVVGHARLTTAACVLVASLAALGLLRLESRVQLLKLLDSSCPLIADYAWLEEHLGNLVPMEVIVSVPNDRQRGPDDVADDGNFYRLSMYERLQLVRDVGTAIEALPPVGHTLSVATFAPAEREKEWSSLQAQRSYRYGVSEQLANARGELTEYLRWERPAAGESASESSELWRVSARIAALADVDYGNFVEQLKAAVSPVLQSQRGRDAVVAKLNEAGKQLVGARIAIIYPVDKVGDPLADDAPEARLKELLDEAGASFTVDGRRGAVLLRDSQLVTEQPDAFRDALAAFDAVLVMSPQAAKAVDLLGELVPPIVDLSQPNATADVAPIEVTYTGVVPLVYKTQRQLLISLRESMVLAVVLITGVMMIPLRSFTAGVISMLPNVFPIVLVFGALGWLGVKIDIGIMMTASVALGVAVDDTLHFVTWFRDGRAEGLDRKAATLHAYDRCGRAMVQTTLIAGLGLAVFAASTFTPTRQFGLLMITILAAALVGDLVMLPAMLVGPLGRFFGSAVTPASTSVSVSSDAQVIDMSTTNEVNKSAEANVEPSQQHQVMPRVSQSVVDEVEDQLPELAVDEKESEATEVRVERESLRPHHLALRNKLRALRGQESPSESTTDDQSGDNR